MGAPEWAFLGMFQEGNGANDPACKNSIEHQSQAKWFPHEVLVCNLLSYPPNYSEAFTSLTCLTKAVSSSLFFSRGNRLKRHFILLGEDSE